MPQVFNVLKCYKCNIFQVQQEKKSNKWICKVCNEKQSLKHVYGSGTGYECRQHVQKVNMPKGKTTEFKSTSMEISGFQDDEGCLGYEDKSEDESTFETKFSEKIQLSRWNKYMKDNNCSDAEQFKMVEYFKDKKFSSPKNFPNYPNVPTKSEDFGDKLKVSKEDPFKIDTDFDFDLY